MKGLVRDGLSARVFSVVCTVGYLWALPLSAQAAETFTEALTDGTVSVQLRYRYELVDQETWSDKAMASTVRSHLGYTTGDYRSFGAFLQLEDVRVAGKERYNSTVNGLTRYPVVADPESTEVNQAYLRFNGLPGTVLRLGRQVIAYNNHRFIGDVGWRQNQQTYDAVALINTSLPATTFSYAHVTNANRIFSDRHPTQSDVEMKSDFFNVAYNGSGSGTLVGYGYLVDYAAGQQPAAAFDPTRSNKTLGLRFEGAGNRGLLYTAEYARQSDYQDGAPIVDADYGYGMLGLEIAGVQLKLNYELLSGDGESALQTPFATLHAHNGWADKFLTTPNDGLEDLFLSVGGRLAEVGLLAVYHQYASDNLGYDFGSEFNLLAAWKVNSLLTLLAKYANYQGDRNAANVARNPSLSEDVSKTWLQAEITF